MIKVSHLGAVVVALGAMVPSQILAQTEESGGTVGIVVGGGLSASPLGNIAERHGTFFVPGRDYEAWLTYRTSGGIDIGVGMLTDRYSIEQAVDIRTNSRFEYTSAGVFTGLSLVEREGFTPVRYGVDFGWRWFAVESDRPGYYSGEQSESRTTGRAVALGFAAGVEFPWGIAVAIPRARMEMSYPSFGGGDGYTDLRKENELGFRASVGIQLKYGFKPGRQSTGSAGVDREVPKELEENRSGLAL
jgi:hypothetical protein